MAGVIAPVPIGSDPGSYAWIEWYTQLTNFINSGVTVSWAQIGFAGSTLTSIADRKHADLQTINGVISNAYAYHMFGIGRVSGGVITTIQPGWSVATSGSTYTITFPTAVTSVNDLIVTATSFTGGVTVSYWTPLSATSFSVTLSSSGNFSFMVGVIESST